MREQTAIYMELSVVLAADFSAEIGKPRQHGVTSSKYRREKSCQEYRTYQNYPRELTE